MSNQKKQSYYKIYNEFIREYDLFMHLKNLIKMHINTIEEYQRMEENKEKTKILLLSRQSALRSVNTIISDLDDKGVNSDYFGKELEKQYEEIYSFNFNELLLN